MLFATEPQKRRTMLFAFAGNSDSSNANILNIATQIKTPLMLAGLAILVLLLLFRGRLTKDQSYMVFFLALVAEILAVVAFMLPPPSNVATFDGTVFSPKNSTKSVPQATVYFAVQGHVIRRFTTEETGYFAFQVDKSDFGKQGQVYVAAKGYKDSPMLTIQLDSNMDRKLIYLDPDYSKSATTLTNIAVANVGRVSTPVDHMQASPVAQAQLANCLSGDWKEVLKGRDQQDAQPNLWHFSLTGKDALTVTRADGFASMKLTRLGDDYRGDLVWQTDNHDVWHNIALTPSSDCQAISTNLQWSFAR